LPAPIDPAGYHQFRFLKRRGRLAVRCERLWLGELEVAPGPSGVGLVADGGVVGFDCVRVVGLGPVDS
jgi:hypothetical protein